MESFNSDNSQEKRASLSEKDYEGLTLNLNPQTDDSHDTKEGDMLEDDLELLEYQRSRSTPKIVIQEFEDEEDVAESKKREAQRKNELFSQFYESHMKKKYENPKQITLEELAKHNSEFDCWTVVNGKVYNLTQFVKMHPGGKKILKAIGIDGTEIFNSHHKNIEIEDTVLACFFEGLLKQ